MTRTASDRRVLLLPTQPEEPTLPSLQEWSSRPSRKLVALLRTHRPHLRPSDLGGVYSVPRRGPRGVYWSRLQPGDLILFYRFGAFFAHSWVAATIDDARVADAQWPDSGAEEPCVLIYTSPVDCKVPLARFLPVVGYKPTFIPRGFRTLDPEKSARVWERFRLPAAPAHLLAGRGSGGRRNVMTPQ